MRGDAEVMLALWPRSDEVTYLDPRGNLHQGWAELHAYWEAGALANREAPGAIVTSGLDVRIVVNKRLGYTLTRETLRKSGSDVAERTYHTTNIYRHEDD